MENKKKKINIELTELFMAKADWKRCFHGTITRTKDENGNELLHGKIYVKNAKHDCIIYAMASDKDTLGAMLDEIVIMILDKGLHKTSSKNNSNIDSPFPLN